MPIYRVNEHRITHTCPADPEPHAIDIRRTIVHVTAPQPCHTPVTITCGDITATVACGTHEPYERQCGACRNIVTVGTVTAEHLGYQGPAHLAPQPALFEASA